MKRLFFAVLVLLMLIPSAFADTNDNFYDQMFIQREVCGYSFFFPRSWHSSKSSSGSFVFKSSTEEGTAGGLASISVTNASVYGDVSSPNLLETIFLSFLDNLKSTSGVSDLEAYKSKHDDFPLFFANYFMSVNEKKHPTTMILYILGGNLISFTFADENENPDTVTERALDLFCTIKIEDQIIDIQSSAPTIAPTIAPTASPIPHIYDDVKILPVYNGLRTEVIGEVSLVYATTAECTEDALADWYFNHVSVNNYNWCMILFSDRNDGSGVYAFGSLIQKDVVFEKDENGDYCLSESSGATFYVPDGNKLVAL